MDDDSEGAPQSEMDMVDGVPTDGLGKGMSGTYMKETLGDVSGRYSQQEWRKISAGGRLRGMSH
jgi:hypothetical protein